MYARKAIFSAISTADDLRQHVRARLSDIVYVSVHVCMQGFQQRVSCYKQGYSDTEVVMKPSLCHAG